MSGERGVELMDAIIKTEKLRVEYRARGLGQTSKVAVKELTFEVRRGEVFGFLGPNGAGKTTTMQVLLGFTPPTSGMASLFGVDVRLPIARQRIGYLPELTYYYKFLTAEELLRFYARLFGISAGETEVRIDRLLRLVELEETRGKPIKHFSKGMQQRIGMAQALINDPELLLLDEPTSGLDPLGRMKVRDIIRRLKGAGKTVFFSSHELGAVETVCDRVAILLGGELMAQGTVGEERSSGKGGDSGALSAEGILCVVHSDGADHPFVGERELLRGGANRRFSEGGLFALDLGIDAGDGGGDCGEAVAGGD